MLSNWQLELDLAGGEPANDPRCADLRKRIERYADQGKGECWLKNSKIAALIEQAMLHFDGERYRLLTWCIMPNHVHALIETFEGFPLGDVIHSWKSFTAKEANRLLNRTGTFWMPDYFDRYIRDTKHFEAAIHYIEENPVKAGLCRLAQEWTWSSAGKKKDDEDVVQEGRADLDVAGETPAIPEWHGAQGLAEDVRYYGKWMRDEAEKRIGYLYPKVEVTADMVKDRPDLKSYVGKKLTVIAWLGSQAEVERELAYRLYTICERKKRAQEALSYNGLVQSWPEILRLAQEGGKPGAAQGTLFEN